MNDLTILYYTCHRISGAFAGRVRRELVARVAGLPIIAVSQNGTLHDEVEISADFSNRLVCPVLRVQAPVSIAQVYRNVLMAAQSARTEFVAFCEDDSLYTAAHFTYRPADDVFAYNEHRLILSRRLSDDGHSRIGFYFENPRTQMAMGLCSRALLVETLTERFEKHPNPPLETTIAKKAGHGEPGRYEKNLGLPRRKLERFKWSAQPNITINHASSLMGRRAYRPDMPQFNTVEPWGDADALWARIHG